jgi:hypothetical protein
MMMVTKPLMQLLFILIKLCSFLLRVLLQEVFIIYFSIDANKKEELYAKETDPGLIEYRYDNYNRAYKLRNISIAAFAGIWLYSQIDLLFFSDLFEVNIKESDVLGKNQFEMNFTYRF